MFRQTSLGKGVSCRPSLNIFSQLLMNSQVYPRKGKIMKTFLGLQDHHRFCCVLFQYLLKLISKVPTF